MPHWKVRLTLGVWFLAAGVILLVLNLADNTAEWYGKWGALLCIIGSLLQITGALASRHNDKENRL